MVRESLKQFYREGQNVPRTYTGRVSDMSCLGCRDGYRVLISDVALVSGEQITDHLWLRFDVMPQTLGLNFGDPVRFTGIVQNYKKQNGQMDFGIVAAQESISKGAEV